ncbi:MAG TPA: ABC transporter substrate-binding protein [Acidimicrobiia bacterium]|nr:ABC transporter substrate-binding protein [Acidimicrobiia bacterium]
MKRSLWALVAVALAVGAGLVPATAGAQQGQGTPDTDVGVTADTIRIAVIADVDNPVQPGLFQGTVKGVQAFAKYINSHGKLAGRNVQVDFIDSHLSADEARNAVIRACSEDFAMVGTNALFLNNVQPMEQCVDKAGQAVGLPDVPTLQTETPHQCSPISFAVIAAAIDCATVDQHPQTYSARVGQIVQYYKKQNKGLNGVWVLPSDLKSTINSTTPVATGDVKAGVKKDEDFFKISGLATQSDYTPVAQAIKQHNSTYAQSISDYKSSMKMRKEAKVQGVTSVKVWDCALQCYDAKFLSEGGADVEGQYASLFFIPFEEAKQNKSVDAFLKSIGGKSQADGFAAQAWTSGLFFRDVVNNVVKANGNNGLTRSRFLEEARKIHDFRAEVNGQGMLGPTDVGGKKLNGCFVLTQVKNGKYVRIFPKEKGTLNCDSKNVTTIQLDQT